MDAPSENLDALELRLAAADRGATPPPGEGAAAPGEAPAKADEASEWITAAVHFGRMARELMPDRVRPAWTDERLQKVGVELAACAKHYGWTFGGMLNHPLAKLAVAAFPLAWPLIEPMVLPYIKGMAGGAVHQVPPAADTPPPPPPPPPPAASFDQVAPIGS